MFRLLKKVIILIMSTPLTWGYCLFLKNQECAVRKVIIGNDYDNPYYNICLPDSIKNINVKSLDLISQKLVFKNILFYKTCKCGCLLDEKVCNNLQRWKGNKCRWECLKIKKCNIGYSWHANNCRCEMKKLTALTKSERSLDSERFIETEECDVETDEIKNVSECKAFPENKTVTLIK